MAGNPAAAVDAERIGQIPLFRGLTAHELARPRPLLRRSHVRAGQAMSLEEAIAHALADLDM